jgi:ABC-2 type transport system permease protein
MTNAFSFFRVGWIAHNTLREAAREKLFHLFLLLGFAGVVGARGLRDFAFGMSELKFVADCGFGAIALFGALLAIVVPARLFFREVDTGTLLTLLAKPVRRAEFLLGKFLAVVALTAVFCGFLTVLLAAVLWTRESELLRQMPETFLRGERIGFGAVLLGGFLQWLKLCVLTAFVLLIASFAETELFVVACGFAVLIICHLQHLVRGFYGRGAPSLGRQAAMFVADVFPNFQLFDLPAAVASSSALAWPSVVRIAVYALGYVVAACGLAIFSFRRREL